MSDRPETPLEMAQRHVVEGQERIARQEELIASLDRDGHDDLLPEANELLRKFWEFQALSERHLAHHLAEHAGKGLD